VDGGVSRVSWNEEKMKKKRDERSITKNVCWIECGMMMRHRGRGLIEIEKTRRDCEMADG